MPSSPSPLMLDDDPQPWERMRNEKIRTLAVGVPTMYGKLPCDNVFYGYGPDSKEIMIGIEVKKPTDLVNCVLKTGRLVSQFRNCVEYGVSVMYLLYQGIIRPGPGDGLLEEWKFGGVWEDVEPGITYSHMDNFLNTLQVRGGVFVKRSAWPEETAQQVVDIYNWWQRPPEEHSSVDRFTGQDGAVMLGGQPPLVRRMVKEIEGVGWKRSLDFMKTFSGQGLSTLDVLNMEPKDWTKVPGIGKVTAGRMWDELHAPI